MGIVQIGGFTIAPVADEVARRLAGLDGQARYATAVTAWGIPESAVVVTDSEVLLLTVAGTRAVPLADVAAVEQTGLRLVYGETIEWHFYFAEGWAGVSALLAAATPPPANPSPVAGSSGPAAPIVIPPPPDAPRWPATPRSAPATPPPPPAAAPAAATGATIDPRTLPPLRTADGRSAPVGWHPDPTDYAYQRYWSGETWTAHRRPALPEDALQMAAPIGPVVPLSGWTWTAALIPLLAVALIPGIGYLMVYLVPQFSWVVNLAIGSVVCAALIIVAAVLDMRDVRARGGDTSGQGYVLGGAAVLLWPITAGAYLMSRMKRFPKPRSNSVLVAVVAAFTTGVVGFLGGLVLLYTTVPSTGASLEIDLATSWEYYEKTPTSQVNVDCPDGIFETGNTVVCTLKDNRHGRTYTIRVVMLGNHDFEYFSMPIS